MGGLAGCRGGGGGLSLVVLVSEKPNLVREKSGKSQRILFICGAGNPVLASPVSVSQENPFFAMSFQNSKSSIKMIEHNEINVGMHCMAHSDTGFELGLRVKLIQNKCTL